MVIAGKKIGLTTQIFIAMILGSIFGLVFSQLAMDLEFIGTIWLNCIKMIVVPMVLFTIITGIVSQNINLFCAGVGLSTVPRASMDQQGLRALLKLSESQVPMLNNPVGYPK